MEPAKKQFGWSREVEEVRGLLFDNPLRRDFLTFPEMVAFFQVDNRYGPKWVRMQMAAGNLPYLTYGRDGVLFYIPAVRQAILDNRLAPIRKVQDDKNQKQKKGNSIRSCSSIQGASSLKEFRQLAGSQ